MEQSAAIHLIGGFWERVLATPLRAYGVFFLTFALYSFLLSSARNYLSGAGWFSISSAITGAVGVLFSLPLLCTSKQTTLSKGLIQSTVFSGLLFDLLGLEREYFEKSRTAVSGVLAGFLGGMGFATLTLVVPEKSLWQGIFLLIFGCIAYARPESAMLLCCLCVPFSSGGFVRVLLLLTAIFFLVKLLRGKRNLKFSVYSGAMLLYGVFVLFCGLVRPSGADFEVINYLTLLLAFFIPALLFHKKEWIASASSVLSLGATVVAIGALLLFLVAMIPSEYRTFFSMLEDVSLLRPFRDDFFGALVVLTAPVFAVRLMTDARVKSRLFVIVTLAVFALAAVLSKDLGVWISFALCLCFTLIFNRNISLFPILSVLGCGVLGYLFLLPESIKQAIEGYCNGFSADFSAVNDALAQSATRFFAGIGFGGGAHDGTLYSTLLSEQGMVGVVILVFVLFGVLSYATFAAYKKEGTDKESLTLTGGFSVAFISALVLGAFTDLFASETLTFFFFFLAGCLCACAKTLCEEGDRAVRSTEIDRDYLFVPVIRREKRKAKNKKKTAEGLVEGALSEEESAQSESLSESDPNGQNVLSEGGQDREG